MHASNVECASRTLPNIPRAGCGCQNVARRCNASRLLLRRLNAAVCEQGTGPADRTSKLLRESPLVIQEENGGLGSSGRAPYFRSRENVGSTSKCTSSFGGTAVDEPMAMPGGVNRRRPGSTTGLDWSSSCRCIEVDGYLQVSDDEAKMTGCGARKIRNGSSSRCAVLADGVQV